MDHRIDQYLDQAFTEENVKQVFLDYLEAKWDQFSNPNKPKIKLQFGADGVTYQSFYKQLDRHTRNICRRIQEGSYYFYPFREENKEKKPTGSGKYRIISVASIRDVLVQKILYQHVLYRPMEKLFSDLDHPRVVSFAYRKSHSAPKAASTVREYIDLGFRHVLDADICKFFDILNHEQLLIKVASVIRGTESRTYELVERFIQTDRVEEATYLQFGKKIFHNITPQTTKRLMGVPQGGVLSGLLANLYLHEFDEWIARILGERFDLRYVRYADDFIILTKHKEDLNPIRDLVDQKLSEFSLDLELHPIKTTQKNIHIETLEFVGFSFDQSNMRVKADNINAYQEDIREILEELGPIHDPDNIGEASERIRGLSRKIANKVLGLSIRKTCPKCGFKRIGPPRSWISFFKEVTDENQIPMLDNWTRKQVYEDIYKNFGLRISRRILKKAKLKSLVNECYRLRFLRLQPCLCDLDKYGLWRYSDDLYSNTLANYGDGTCTLTA